MIPLPPYGLCIVLLLKDCQICHILMYMYITLNCWSPAISVCKYMQCVASVYPTPSNMYQSYSPGVQAPGMLTGLYSNREEAA